MTVEEFMKKCAEMLPTVTETSKGFMSSDCFRQILKFRKHMLKGEEWDLNVTTVGVYYIHSNVHGGGGLFSVSSYAGSTIIGGDFLHHYSNDPNSYTKKIFFGRKKTNGNIFLINDSEYDTTITIERL